MLTIATNGAYTVADIMENPLVRESLDCALDSIEQPDGLPDPIGIGGEGIVFSVFAQGRHLAVKTPNYLKHPNPMTPRAMIKNEGDRARFLEENGADFIPHHVMFDDGGRYVVREFVEGQCLEEALSRMPFDRRLGVLESECRLARRAFGFLHKQLDRQYVIRDLKAANIICEPSGELVLIDIGGIMPLSSLGCGGSDQVAANLGTGLKRHLPPEDLLQQRSLCSEKVDWFAWGVLAYRTLFLDYPYPNTAKSPGAMHRQYRACYRMAKQKMMGLVGEGVLDGDLAQTICQALDPRPLTRRFAPEQ